MATGSLLPPQQMTRHSPVAVIEYDRYIDQQIRRTSWQVKLVDLVSRLLTIGVGLLSVLLLAAIVEHWVIPGGLSSWLRWIAFFLIVSLIGWYAIRFLWPLVAMQINPIYSAQTIERQNPQLKNSLLNLLFFRQKREQVPHVVYQAVEQQAALRLSTTSSETAVDRTFLVHTMLVFLGLFVIACLYQVLSPKNPLTTAGRVLLPWADIRTPTRVLIEDLRPQDVEAARGEQIEITAVVRGQRDSEPVLLRFSTEDGQIVEQAIPMTLGKNENQYHGILPQEPPPGRPPGIQQNMRYSIEAGDARTPNYRITLIEQPTITVDRIELDFPAYTLFTRQIQKYQGDIRAIEGTRVTVHAQTNQLFHSGYIDLNSNGRNKVQLNPTDNDSRNVSGSFELTLDADRGTPEFLNYALRFRNQAGQQNRQPIRYRIDTVPDYAPEITILSPTEEVVDVRFSETLLVEIESRDPDFALKHVQILGEIDRETVLKQDLLTEEFVGRFSGIWACIPAKMELQVGDEITYWAEAADNRAPNANISVSKRRRIRVIADLATDQSAEDSQDESSGSQNAEATGSNPSETPDSKKSQPTDSKDTTPTDAKDSEPTDSKDATPTDAKDSEPTDSKDATPTDAKDSEPTDSKDATPTGTQDSEPTDSKDATP
ncbi:MAG: hypothetical protein JW829_12500, partial [Pirellulales bacterium]|nr:hypothetical protein [Pirellulales bacterium]